MLWAVFWVVSLARGCGCEESEWALSSIAEAVRLGMAMGTTGGQSEQAGGDRREGGEGEKGLMGLMLRLMGGDLRKAQEFAFEGFISLVHLMSRVLVRGGGKKRGQRGSRGFSLFRFIVNRIQATDVLVQMQDPDLIDRILEESDRKLKRFPAEHFDCIQVLTCKTKPFVRGMQRALEFFMQRENASLSGGGAQTLQEPATAAAWEKADLIERMYFFMPSLAEVVEHGDGCDHRFPTCIY